MIKELEEVLSWHEDKIQKLSLRVDSTAVSVGLKKELKRKKTYVIHDEEQYHH